MKTNILSMLLIVALSATFIKCQSREASESSPVSIKENAGNDTLSKNVYDDNRLQQIVLRKDSGECEKMVLTFYHNGNLKSKGCQGHYADKNTSTGMYVGVWAEFDSLGHLIGTTFYHNDEPLKAFIEKTTYYADGNRKSIERFNNYELYESDIDSIGDWKYYSEDGKLIKTIKHNK
jgi:antitoxin component YwqK of YwqJK toxin-antitoxin module